MYIVINNQGKYYTNDLRRFEGRTPFLWSSHRRLAKHYVRQSWAKKVAKKVGGSAMRAL